MDTEIDFTIVTPSYNYSKYIRECLNSVRDQKGVTCEHLVFDAGSTDGTIDIIREYDNVTLVVEPDKGMSDAINKGFQKARGKWVMWLNTDDLLKPGALEKTLKFAASHVESDVIYGAWDYINARGDYLRTMSLFPFQHRMLIHYGCYIGSTACFYRRETTIQQGLLLNVNFHYCMDGEYYARLASFGKQFCYIPECLADFRLHDKSISQQNLNSEGIDGLLKQQIQFAEPKSIRRTYGTTLFQSDHLNNAVDCFLFYYYGGWKIILRWLQRKSLL